MSPVETTVPLHLPNAEIGTNQEPSEVAPNRCPRRLGQVVISMSTGQIKPQSCSANFCSYCGPGRAFEIGRAISLSEPQRAVLLTGLPADWDGIRHGVKMLSRSIRRASLDWEWCWHVEPNPAGTGHHLHGWQHGEQKIPQDFLADASERAGFGRVTYINRVRQRVGKGNSTTYGLKGLSYGMKEADQAEFLRCNGGRLVHASRAFWRDGNRGPRLTMAEAIERASEEPEDEGPWIPCHEEHASHVLSAAGF